MRHDMKWVGKMADDYFQSHPLQKFLVGKIILNVMKKKLKPYIKQMEQGINPLSKKAS